jgi:hypothetical protein
MDWFKKYFLPPISKDVSMVEEITEEKDILSEYNLDLIYSQSGTLYLIIHPLGFVPSIFVGQFHKHLSQLSVA